MTAVLGPKPPAQKFAIEDFDKRIVSRGGPVVVLNDEAHHTHDEDSEWNKIVRALHAGVSGGVAAQLDFTATPRHSKGQLFSWTVFDYPLKQAIIDNVVKRPLKGIAQGNHGAAVGRGQHALSGLSGGGRRTLEGVPRTTAAHLARSRCCS